MTRAALIALFLALATQSTASARVDVVRELTAANAYWTLHGVQPGCAAVSWSIVDLPGDEAGHGWPQPFCRVAFDPDALRLNRRAFCLLAVHEVGHVNGLEHGDPRFPVMSGRWQRMYSVRTPFCDGAAKIGRLRRAKRRARTHLDPSILNQRRRSQ